FQAEDGIRDGHVTGVQTCALPIFSMTLVASDKNTSSHSCSVAMYELHGASVPAAGTYSVVVSYTNGSNDSQAAVCMSFRGIKPRSEERRVGKECRSRW